MSGKIIAQLLLAGAQIVSKAFGMAYQNALKNSKPGRPAPTAPVLKGRMSVDEALLVLNVQRDGLTAKQIDEKFSRMFPINDPAAGGSFYLQSKIFRAK